jgi:hypothetical protein
MMPHLGVLSTVHEQSATEVFNKDCLVPLGCCIAPVGEGRDGANVLRIKIEEEKGISEKTIKFGEIELIPLPMDKKVKLILHPERGFDVGNGKGKVVDVVVSGGVVGIIFDCRGRPFVLPEDKRKKIESLNRWFKAVNMYPA